MALSPVNDNTDLKANKRLDSREGPYADLPSALAAIDEIFRVRSLTVYIINGTEIDEYWFKSGTADADLVQKTGGGGGNGIFDAANNGSTTPSAMVVDVADTLSFNSGNVDLENGVWQQGVQVLNATNFNVFLGESAGNNTLTGNGNLGIGQFALASATTGLTNIGLGFGALFSMATGSFNTIIGGGLFFNTNGSGNTSLGNGALFNTAGSNNVGLGFNAGFNETGSNKLYIHGLDTNITNEATGRSQSIIYGVMDGNLANQTLRFNAKVTIPSSSNSTDSLTLGNAQGRSGIVFNSGYAVPSKIYDRVDGTHNLGMTFQSRDDTFEFISSSGTTPNANIQVGKISELKSISGGDTSPLIIQGAKTSNDAGDGVFIETVDNTNTMVERFEIQSGSATVNAWFNNISNLGVNTITPQTTLHINGTLRLENLPTSSAGLSAGDVWNDAGDLKII